MLARWAAAGTCRPVSPRIHLLQQKRASAMTQRTYPAGMTPTAISLGSTAQASIRRRRMPPNSWRRCDGRPRPPRPGPSQRVPGRPAGRGSPLAGPRSGPPCIPVSRTTPRAARRPGRPRPGRAVGAGPRRRPRPPVPGPPARPLPARRRPARQRAQRPLPGTARQRRPRPAGPLLRAGTGRRGRPRTGPDVDAERPHRHRGHHRRRAAVGIDGRPQRLAGPPDGPGPAAARLPGPVVRRRRGGLAAAPRDR